MHILVFWSIILPVIIQILALAGNHLQKSIKRVMR